MALLSTEAAAAVQVFVPNPSPYEGPVEGGGGLHYVDVDGNDYGPITSTSPGLPFCVGPNLEFGGIVPTYDSEHEYLFVGEGVNMGCYTQYQPTLLSPGDIVGSENAVVDSPYLAFDFANYTPDEVFFLGYGFRDKGSSDTYKYGWLEFSYSSDSTLSVYSWGYEDQPGVATPIPGAAIPEPSQIALVAGGLGLAAVAMRKRLRASR